MTTQPQNKSSLSTTQEEYGVQIMVRLLGASALALTLTTPAAHAAYHYHHAAFAGYRHHPVAHSYAVRHRVAHRGYWGGTHFAQREGRDWRREVTGRRG